MGAGPAIVSSGTAAYTHLLDTKPWYKNTRLLVLNFWIAIMQTADNHAGSMMNGLQSLTQWNQAFDYPTGGKLGLLNAIQNIGSLCGYPFAPYMADNMGRRFSILFGASLMIAATAIQTASQSVQMFIGARFLIGFGLTFAASAAPLLVTEVAYPSHRGQATSMYNTLWYLGSIIAAWTTYGTFRIPSSWAWRVPSALQGLPSVIQVFLIWFVPESPRWLVSHGKEDKALQILAYYHANGNEQDPLVEYEFEEIKAAIAFDREVAANVGWLSLVKNPGNRKRMRIIIALAIFSQWSGNGLCTLYTLYTLHSPTIQNGLLNIFNFIVAIGAGFCCDRAGRRPLFLTSCVGMIVFWTAQTICFSIDQQTGSLASGHAVIVFIFLFYGFCKPLTENLAFTPLIVSYTVEILPYAIRAKGFIVFNFVLSLSLIFNQYVNPIALNALQWKYYLVYLFWQCFELVFCYIFIVETKNRTLEETAALFEGEEGLKQIADQAAIHAGLVHRADEIEEKETKSESEVATN
ncbi:general substrate transporter [Leucogyrophana mollusca]|uniref:General substrate transporter n=1 Tax=Leucogyrophana mollusca TaxID=85980 RepID=A0ACB8BU10_9AGAM|nr:general substrate transporter [Leucogyrophana mollusca]